MQQRQLIKLLLLPSLLSGTCTLVATLAILGYAAWSYISQNLLFYDLFFGAYGVETLLWEWSGNEPAWQQAFLHSPVAYYIFVVGCAIVAGIVAYMVVEGVRSLFKDTTAALHSFSHEARMRLEVRMAGIIGWALYFAFFVSTMVPTVFLLTEIGIDLASSDFITAVLYWLGAFILLFVALHMHIIFLRLCLLRPRVFGGWDVQKAAILADHEE